MSDDETSARRDGPAYERTPRIDAQRNLEALLRAAKAVFEESGVEAPVREIAQRAGVGTGTLYRHFPRRTDLVAAVFRREIDDCADAASILTDRHGPAEALDLWLQRYAAFIATKRGLAPALHSGDPAYDGLRDHFSLRLKPALRVLLDEAVAAGAVRADVDSEDLRKAVTSLCLPGRDGAHASRMVALLVDGMRYGAPSKIG